MMRLLRALAFFAVGLLLGGVSVYASAETINATNQQVTPTQGYTVGGYWGASGQAACQAFWNSGARYGATSLADANMSTMRCQAWYGTSLSTNWAGIVTAYRCAPGGTIYSTVPNCGTAMVCPTGQNWTLSGSQCTRPDCVAPEVRDPIDGVCKPPVCPSGQSKTVNVFSGKWAVCGTQNAGCLTGTLSLPSTYCDGACVYSMEGGFTGGTASGSPSVSNPVPVFINMNGTSTGSQCSQVTDVSAGTPPVIPQKPPPCAAGEGVLTSSSGSVKCVPSGTPGNTPQVATSTRRTETPTDIVQTTTTTTTDPVSGASSRTTSTTTTPKSGGTGGTTTTTTDVPRTPGQTPGDNSGDEPGQCAKEPNSPMCKTGAPKEKGQFQSISEVDQEVLAAKSALLAKFNEVKTQAAALFTNVGGGTGSLPCPAPITIMGRPISFCMSQYEGQLSMIGAAVILLASILSAFIVLKR